MISAKLLVMALCLISSAATAEAQSTETAQPAKKYQAKAPAPQPFGAEAFGPSNETTIRWLGNAGFFINSRGTNLMLDPLLEGFDMPVLFKPPIAPADVPRLDAVLITHGDNDHFSLPTLRKMASATREFHSTAYVAALMRKEGWKAFGHGIGEVFSVGPIQVKLTPADHAWQNSVPEERAKRLFKDEDACGFWIETPDGTIWAPGDSRLMPEHLKMPAPDAIFFDFSDSEWHFGLEGAVKIANAYPNTPLLLSHWGTVDAPDFTPFNGDPKSLYGRVVNPDRIKVLAPGEPFHLKPLKDR